MRGFIYVRGRIPPYSHVTSVTEFLSTPEKNDSYRGVCLILELSTRGTVCLVRALPPKYYGFSSTPGYAALDTGCLVFSSLTKKYIRTIKIFLKNSTLRGL